jgi:hypothetical protein
VSVRAIFLDGPLAGQELKLPADFLTVVVSNDLDGHPQRHIDAAEFRGGEQMVFIVGASEPRTRYTLGRVNDRNGTYHYHQVR